MCVCVCVCICVCICARMCARVCGPLQQALAEVEQSTPALQTACAQAPRHVGCMQHRAHINLAANTWPAQLLEPILAGGQLLSSPKGVRPKPCSEQHPLTHIRAHAHAHAHTHTHHTNAHAHLGCPCAAGQGAASLPPHQGSALLQSWWMWTAIAGCCCSGSQRLLLLLLEMGWAEKPVVCVCVVVCVCGGVCNVVWVGGCVRGWVGRWVWVRTILLTCLFCQLTKLIF